MHEISTPTIDLEQKKGEAHKSSPFLTTNYGSPLKYYSFTVASISSMTSSPHKLTASA